MTAGLQSGDDSRTRDLVARSILENGPSTAAVLGERLGLTPAGIRRHLDLLVADGVLEARDPRASSIRGVVDLPKYLLCQIKVAKPLSILMMI